MILLSSLSVFEHKTLRVGNKNNALFQIYILLNVTFMEVFGMLLYISFVVRYFEYHIKMTDLLRPTQGLRMHFWKYQAKKAPHIPKFTLILISSTITLFSKCKFRKYFRKFCKVYIFFECTNSKFYIFFKIFDKNAKFRKYW